jgi:hypothetical protein
MARMFHHSLMIKRKTFIKVHLILFLSFGLLSGCYSGVQTKQNPCPSNDSLLKEGYIDATFHSMYLQSIYVNDIDGLKDSLISSLWADILVLNELLEYENCYSSEEREKALDTLRLIAVQNEKYPVSQWHEDKEINDIIINTLKFAMEENPEKTKEYRSRDWSKQYGLQ